MDKIVQWFRYYNQEITWFVIGFLVASGLYAMAHGNYITALIDFGLAYINYALNRR